MAEYLSEEDMNTGEYISRDEALKMFHQCCDNCTSSYNGVMCRACADAGAMDILIDIPAADVQPIKHGRWIEQKHTPTNGYNYNVPYSTYICSSCGLEIHNDEYSKYVRGTYTNCPVCTAKMNIIYEDDKIRAIKVTG